MYRIYLVLFWLSLLSTKTFADFVVIALNAQFQADRGCALLLGQFSSEPEEQRLQRLLIEQPNQMSHYERYAGWLESHGQGERAQFMRLQIRNEPLRQRLVDLRPRLRVEKPQEVHWQYTRLLFQLELDPWRWRLTREDLSFLNSHYGNLFSEDEISRLLDEQSQLDNHIVQWVPRFLNRKIWGAQFSRGLLSSVSLPSFSLHEMLDASREVLRRIPNVLVTDAQGWNELQALRNLPRRLPIGTTVHATNELPHDERERIVLRTRSFRDGVTDFIHVQFEAQQWIKPDTHRPTMGLVVGVFDSNHQVSDLHAIASGMTLKIARSAIPEGGYLSAVGRVSMRK